MDKKIKQMIEDLEEHLFIEKVDDWNPAQKLLLHFEEAKYNGREIPGLFCTDVLVLKRKLSELQLSGPEKLVFDLLDETSLDVIIEKTEHWRLSDTNPHTNYDNLKENAIKMSRTATSLLIDLWSTRFRC